jgi:hypothetical protein
LPICPPTFGHLGDEQISNPAKRSKGNSGLIAFFLLFFEKVSSAIFLAFGSRAE